jgi:hypothetical protein
MSKEHISYAEKRVYIGIDGVQKWGHPVSKARVASLVNST